MRSPKAAGLAVALLLLAGCGSSPVERANEALAMGDGARAARDFALALDDDPSDTASRRGLGEALVLVAREKAKDGEDLPADWSKASRELQRGGKDSTIEPLLAEAGLAWAKAMLRHGDTGLAVAGLEARLKSAPRSHRERNLLAIVMDRQGERDRAAELFLENARQDSSDVDSWFNLALVDWARGRRIQAAEHLLQAAKRSPDDPEILYWLGKMSDAEASR